MPALLDARCQLCGVLSGAPHHLCCGYSPELFNGKLVRLSPQPCEFCGEFFPITHYKQKRHTQNPDCRAKAKRAQERERWHNLPPEKKHNCRRAQESHRAAERAQTKAVRDDARAVYRKVERPLSLAARMASRYYRWLRKIDKEAYEQTLHLALLELGIDPHTPAELDIRKINLSVRSNMRKLQSELGFKPIRENADGTCERIPAYCDIAKLTNSSPCNWNTAWYSA